MEQFLAQFETFIKYHQFFAFAASFVAGLI
jgi:hypothetical protein